MQQHPDHDKEWYTTSNTIVLLKGEMTDIWQIILDAQGAGQPVATFHEPDLDNRMTAIATTYGHGKVRKLKLLGS